MEVMALDVKWISQIMVQFWFVSPECLGPKTCVCLRHLSSIVHVFLLSFHSTKLLFSLSHKYFQVSGTSPSYSHNFCILGEWLLYPLYLGKWKITLLGDFRREEMVTLLKWQWLSILFPKTAPFVYFSMLQGPREGKKVKMPKWQKFPT